MATVHIIRGATGAGKTTYVYDLAAREGGVRFSIDPWMQELFHPEEAVASFTNPAANESELACMYYEEASRRSWATMTDFLSDVFSESDGVYEPGT